MLGILLVILATLCYILPTLVASSEGIDIKAIPLEYYNHHIWRTSGAFLLTAIYAGCFFFMVPEKLIVLKIFSCHLFLMETLSFIIHVIKSFFLKTGYSPNQIVLTLTIFSVCLVFFTYRALKNKTGDEFDSRNTYLIVTKPKNIIGFLNYLIRHKGHLSIYQDGYVYRFTKRTKQIERSSMLVGLIDQDSVLFKRIKRVNNIERFVGIKYNLFNYNCNTFSHDAQH